MEHTDHSEELDLQKYWLVLKRRWLPAVAVFGLVVTLAAMSTSLKEAVYQAEGRLLLRTNRNSSSLTGLETSLGDLTSTGRNSNPLVTEAEIIRSLPIAQQVVDDLGLKNEEGEPFSPKALLGRLEVTRVEEADLLELTYKSENPEEAAAVVNQVMKVYMEYNTRLNRDEAAAAREFIIEQLPKTEIAVREADAALREFRENNGVVVLNEEASASVRIISGLDQEIAQVQAELAQANARSAELQGKVGMSPDQAVDLSSLNQSPAVQQALTELQQVQSELATQRTLYRDNYPTVVTLRRREAALQALLGERIGQILESDQQVPVGRLQTGQLRQQLTSDLVQAEVTRLGIAGRLNALVRAQSVYEQRASVFPALEQNQRELERQVQAAQTTYEALLTKLQEVQVAENQNIGNARIVSPAQTPGSPIDPGRTKALAVGGFLGLVLGVATAFGLDLIDNSVKTVKEAKELFGYTLLGVIPVFSKFGKVSSRDDEDPSSNQVFVRDIPRSPVSQAYQMLQANLKFTSSDKRLKVIAVTSSVQREGKSSVAANLAAALAQVGHRVLLVDGDMRHPTQHHIWDLTNSVGLSNVIVGQAKLSAAIKEVMPSLHVLTAGVIPPNPVALLDSKRMAALTEHFSKSYNFVIIDTPALSGIADAPIIGKVADGILLVVRPRVVNAASANAAKEFLKQSNQNILGLVANGVVVKSEPDSYFYYTKENYMEPNLVVQEPAVPAEQALSKARNTEQNS